MRVDSGVEKGPVRQKEKRTEKHQDEDSSQLIWESAVSAGRQCRRRRGKEAQQDTGRGQVMEGDCVTLAKVSQ